MSDQRAKLDTINKELECKKCLKSFQEPKLLPCFHVFCKSPCLEEIAAQDPDGKTLTCPICEYRVILPENGVTGLPTDFQAEYNAEQRKAIEKAQNPHCENCKLSPATNYCPDCKKFMCDKCRALHQTWEAFKDHKLLSTDQVRANAVKILLPKKEPLRCEKHPKMELRMYCETCSKLICSDCTIRLHKDHSYDVVNDLFEKHKGGLVASMKELTVKLENVDQALIELDTRQGMIENQSKDVEEHIEKEIQQLKIILDQRKNILLASLKSQTKQKLDQLADQKESIKKIHKTMSSCLDYAKAGLETGTEGEVLRMKEPTLKRIEEITVNFDPDTLQPKTEADIEFICDDKVNIACRELGNVTSVSAGDDNSYATGEGVRFAQVGIQTSLEVHQAINRTSNRSGENFPLAVELSHTKTKAKIDCNYIREENGRHMITYQPVSRGAHSLHIRVNGRHIQGSPYSIAVTPSFVSLRTPTKVWQTLNEPYGIAVNSKGEVVMAGQNKDCVYISSSEGQTISQLGEPGSRESQPKGPRGVTIDKNDNIYVVDSYNHRIQKFKPDGSFVENAGSKGRGEGGTRLLFKNPAGICYNKTNDLLYVCDQGNHRIQVLTTDLTFVKAFGENGTGNGAFDCPLYLAFDSANNLYVTDANNNRVQVFTTEGVFLRMFYDKNNGSTLRNPTAIAIDSGDAVYVSEYHNHCVSMFTSQGEYLGSFGGPGQDNGKFNGINGLCIDQDDTIYVSDSRNKKLQIF